MGAPDQIALAILGAAGPGGRFKLALDAIDGVRVQAVCDIAADGLAAAAERFGAQAQYLDYEEMPERPGLVAVIVGTPMPYHVPQAVAALNRNIHALSEIPAGVSVEECRELAEAVGRSWPASSCPACGASTATCWRSSTSWRP